MRKIFSVLIAWALILSCDLRAYADACDSCVQGCYGHCDPQVACAAACSSSVEIYTPTVRPIDMGYGSSSGGGSSYSSGGGSSYSGGGGSYSSGGGGSSSGCRPGQLCSSVTYQDNSAQAEVDAINAENERRHQAQKAEELRQSKIQARQAIATGIVQMTTLLAVIMATKQSRYAGVSRENIPLPEYGGVTGMPSAKSDPDKDKANEEINDMKKDPDFSSDAVTDRLNKNADSKGKSTDKAARDADCERQMGPGSRSIRFSIDFDGVGNGDHIGGCLAPMPSGKVTSPPPTVKVGTQVFSKAKVDNVINVVQQKQKTVQEKQNEIDHIEFKIPEFKAANKTWKEKRVEAEKKVTQAKPEDKPKKKSMLADIIAEEKKTEELTAKYEKRREEVKADLQTAQKDLTRTKNDAKGAFKDSQSLDAFNQKYEGGIGRNTAAQIPAIDLKGLIPQKIGCKENCAPSVRIWRPSSDEIGFLVEAKKNYGEDAIPYAQAEMKVSWSGYSEDYTADDMGRAYINPVFMSERWPGQQERIDVKVEMEGASHSVAVTKLELKHYIEAGADALIVQGDADFKASRYNDAARKYWESMIWNPTDKGSKGWVASMEKQGSGAGTLSAYQTALVGQAKDPQTRFQFKQKAIRLAQGMKPAPDILPQAHEAWKRGPEAFKKGSMIQALLNEETASSLAPWWAEPYYSMATIYEHMAVHQSFSFAQAAIENYELFLAAAPSGDARTSEAKKGRDRLKELQEVLSQ